MTAPFRLVIRADGDAGGQAGMGHVVRSLAYAKAVAARVPGLDVSFLMRAFPEGVERVREQGYAVVELPVRPTSDDLDRGLAATRPDLLVLDVLGSTPEIIATARRYA